MSKKVGTGLSVLAFALIFAVLFITPNLLVGATMRPEIDTAIMQVDDIHTFLLPIDWSHDNIPTESGWYMCRNLALALDKGVYKFEWFDGGLYIVLGTQWVPTTDLDENWEFSSQIQWWPKDN